MFIKESGRTVNGVKYVYYHIVKSVRTQNGPRHKILANISHLPIKVINQIKLLLGAGKSAVIADLNNFFKKSFLYGPIAFFLLFMKNIGVLSALKPVTVKSRILILAIILNRIIKPRSKLASVSWLKSTAFMKVFGLDPEKLHVNELYRSMDVLYGNMDKVLASFNRPSANKSNRLLLYDITSTYFEGEGPSYAKNGYSRDRRPDRPQILLGMCLNENGFPICFKIFEGNIQDKKTVIGFLEGLNKEFHFNSYIFVGDRGMVTVENLEKIKSIGLGYIVALTHTEARQLLNDIDVQQLELYDKQVPIEILGDVPHKAKYVLCGSEYRKEHDLKLFNKILEKGRKALESVQAMVDNGRIKNHDKIIKRAQKKLTKSNADQYYDFEYKNDMLEIIEKTEKIKLGEKLCGYYILKSTEPSVPDENTEQYYKQLQTVEGAFRELKELVQVRPIFHWNDQRVLTHVYLCVVSQAIINQCRRILKVTRWIYQEKENSIHSFLNILSEIHLGRFNIEGIEEWVVSSLGTDHKKILNMFNINDKEFENYKKANVVKN